MYFESEIIYRDRTADANNYLFLLALEYVSIVLRCETDFVVLFFA